MTYQGLLESSGWWKGATPAWSIEEGVKVKVPWSLKLEGEPWEVERVKVTTAEERREGVVRLVLISDTHNKHRQLVMPPGDLLIHAGDFTERGLARFGIQIGCGNNICHNREIKEFDDWLGSLDMYKHRILVPGNHDTGTDAQVTRLFSSFLSCSRRCRQTGGGGSRLAKQWRRHP